MPTLLQRLKERKLVQWALAYLAGAWVIYEAIATVGASWGLSDTFFRGLFVVLAIGFFITLVLAWYHGEKGRQKVSGPELLMVAALLVIAGGVLSLVAGRGEVPGPGERATSPPVEDPRPSIAVLPLENLSPDPSNGFFADGMQEEITSKLATIPALKVISRSSVMQYRTERPSSPRIAEELGVGFLVEGSARLAGDLVRLVVQLIDAKNDEHLWSEEYDFDLSAENLFEVEGEIARQIAFRVGVNLTPEERDRVGRVLTDNAEAYLLFMQGNEAFLEERIRGLVHSWHRSTGLYEQAVELDPDFALARARFALSLLYTTSRDEETIERARREAEAALALLPGLGEAKVALGRYFQRTGQDQEAIRQYQTVQEEDPNSFLAAPALARLQQRLGEFDAGLRTLRRAEQLSPHDPTVQRDLAWAYTHLHLYDEALHAAVRLQTLDDGNHPYLLRALIHLLRGEAEEARYAISELMAAYPDIPFNLNIGVPFAVVRRVLTSGQRDVSFEAWEAWRATNRDPEQPCHQDLRRCSLQAIYWEEAGSKERARPYWDSLAARIEEGPLPSGTTSVMLALILHGSGQSEAAIQSLEARTLRPDLFYGHPIRRVGLARILASSGREDRAIDILEEELPAPSWLSVPLLEIDPIWDPLRDHPRFQALLDRYADDVEH